MLDLSPASLPSHDPVLAPLGELEPEQLATLWDWGVWTPDSDEQAIQS